MMDLVLKIILIIIGVVLLLKIFYRLIKYVNGKDAKDKKTYMIFGILYGIDLAGLGLLYRLIDSFLKNPGKSALEIVLHSIIIIYVLIGFLLFNSIISKKESIYSYK